jgi:hypothetical protein
MIYIIVTCALHFYILTVRHGINFREALKQGVGSAVAFSMTCVVIWPVLALLSYHLRVRWDHPRISLHHDTYTAFSYSFLTSQRSNRFVGLKIYSEVLFMTSVVDQEPGSQDGHRWPCAAKPVFTREVEQEFCLCPLQAHWILLAGWPWRCYPRQEGG